MKTETTSAHDVPAFAPPASRTQSELSDSFDEPALRSAFGEGGSDSVQASPTQSNQIQPVPPHPGKETVKFLAIFDHVLARSCLNLQTATFNFQLHRLAPGLRPYTRTC